MLVDWRNNEGVLGDLMVGWRRLGGGRITIYGGFDYGGFFLVLISFKLGKCCWVFKVDGR